MQSCGVTFVSYGDLSRFFYVPAAQLMQRYLDSAGSDHFYADSEIEEYALIGYICLVNSKQQPKQHCLFCGCTLALIVRATKGGHWAFRSLL